MLNTSGGRQRCIYWEYEEEEEPAAICERKMRREIGGWGGGEEEDEAMEICVEYRTLGSKRKKKKKHKGSKRFERACST